MFIRSCLRNLVLLALFLLLTTLPCVAVQAGGGPPAGDTGTSWIAPMLDWLGWDALIWGSAEPVTDQGHDDPTGVSTPTLGTDYSTTEEEEDDDRSAAIDPNG